MGSPAGFLEGDCSSRIPGSCCLSPLQSKISVEVWVFGRYRILLFSRKLTSHHGKCRVCPGCIALPCAGRWAPGASPSRAAGAALPLLEGGFRHVGANAALGSIR